jgi:hypothetical protein
MDISRREHRFLEPFVMGLNAKPILEEIESKRMMALAFIDGLEERDIANKRNFLFENLLSWQMIEQISGCEIDSSDFIDTFENKKNNLPNAVMDFIDYRVNAYRKKTVGSVNELFHSMHPTSLSEWESMYFAKYGEMYEDALENHFYKYVLIAYETPVGHLTAKQKRSLRKFMEERAYLLMIKKTYYSYVVQDAIFLHLAEKNDMVYEISWDDTDSKGIDGFLNSQPLSVKPLNFIHSKDYGRHTIVPIIFYTNLYEGVLLDVSDFEKAKQAGSFESENISRNSKEGSKVLQI